VYPALSIYQALADRIDQTLWVGGIGGMEEALVTRENIPYRAIPAAGLHGVGLRSIPGNTRKLFQGIAASRRILREFKPDVILFTGGYVAVPMALAARGIPQFLFVPDIEPGMALKVLSHFAAKVALTVSDSLNYFKVDSRFVVTGYPLRAGLKKLERADALRQMNCTTDRPVILVTGGSKGAHLLNMAILGNLPALLADYQVIHLTGTLDFPEIQAVAAGLPADLSARYHVYPYLHEEMSAAFSCADLAICRAGASTLGELPYFNVPAILVPYPFAWRYQKVNADFLVRNQAARMIENEKLSAELMPALHELFAGEGQNRAHMHLMMRNLEYVSVGAADYLAKLVLELADVHQAKQEGRQ
jgi:UDP-N-acetylglucosamine--N-acetylmuramyl-(pentapeptide) pyrophosphoryl-undecaprenol N-acetylglucosamine transferase